MRLYYCDSRCKARPAATDHILEDVTAGIQASIDDPSPCTRRGVLGTSNGLARNERPHLVPLHHLEGIQGKVLDEGAPT